MQFIRLKGRCCSKDVRWRTLSEAVFLDSLKEAGFYFPDQHKSSGSQLRHGRAPMSFHWILTSVQQDTG